MGKSAHARRKVGGSSFSQTEQKTPRDKPVITLVGLLVGHIFRGKSMLSSISPLYLNLSYYRCTCIAPIMPAACHAYLPSICLTATHTEFFLLPLVTSYILTNLHFRHALGSSFAMSLEYTSTYGPKACRYLDVLLLKIVKIVCYIFSIL